MQGFTNKKHGFRQGAGLFCKKPHTGTYQGCPVPRNPIFTTSQKPAVFAARAGICINRAACRRHVRILNRVHPRFRKMPQSLRMPPKQDFADKDTHFIAEGRRISSRFRAARLCNPDQVVSEKQRTKKTAPPVREKRSLSGDSRRLRFAR